MMYPDPSTVVYPTVNDALDNARAYCRYYMDRDHPELSYHVYPFGPHLELRCTWGVDGYFFVQMRWRTKVEIAEVQEMDNYTFFKGWIFFRHYLTKVWSCIIDSDVDGDQAFWDKHKMLKEA